MNITVGGVSVIVIRRMKKEDAPEVRKICLETANKKLKSTEKAQKATLLLYCDYYIRTSLYYCFVAVDEETNKIVGYILCSPNYKHYLCDFTNVELVELRKLGLKYYLMGKGAILSQKKYAIDFPAHIHIDILPEFQNQGIGSQLMDKLLYFLKIDTSQGIFLSVAPKNKKAKKFYEKYYFEKINLFSMGKRLQGERHYPDMGY